MRPALLGIEIGGTKLQVVVGHNDGRIQQRWRYTVDRSRGAEGIRQQLTACLEEARRAHGQLAAVGVGFGGPVDWQSGTIACSHQIEGWAGFELRQWLEGQVRAPVKVDNDANVAALGEAFFGAGRNFNPVFYVTLGSGVGGGLVVDHRIYHGAKPGEAEIGHVRLNREGATVESRCSGWAMDRRLREHRARMPQSRLSQRMEAYKGAESKCLAAALAESDPDAQNLFQETIEDLAYGLSQVVHLIHPEVIVIGGGLSLVGQPLPTALKAALPRFLMQVFAPGPAIQLAELGEDAVTAGSLALAQDASGSPGERCP